jgi:hypothetical protein
MKLAGEWGTLHQCCFRVEGMTIDPIEFHPCRSICATFLSRWLFGRGEPIIFGYPIGKITMMMIKNGVALF